MAVGDCLFLAQVSHYTHNLTFPNRTDDDPVMFTKAGIEVNVTC